MGVHQAGSDQLALGVYNLSALHGGSGTGAYLGNAAIFTQHPSILQNLDISLLLPLLGALALGGGQHADVGQQ